MGLGTGEGETLRTRLFLDTTLSRLARTVLTQVVILWVSPSWDGRRNQVNRTIIGELQIEIFGFDTLFLGLVKLL